MPLIRFFHIRSFRLCLTCLLAGYILLFSNAAFAEKSQERVAPLSEKQASEIELLTLKENLEKAASRRVQLEQEISLIAKDKVSINRALLETSKQSQTLEQSIVEEEQRLSELSVSRNSLRKSLSSKRSLLSEVLAALQRMGRNPPPAILVRPEDALQSVRSAILLGAVVPEIRNETSTLFAELRALGEISRQINLKKENLAKDLNTLSESETRLSLLLGEKNKLAEVSQQQLLAEQIKSEELAGKARSLEELIGKIETQIATARKAATAAKQADLKRRTEEQERLANAREAIKNGRVPKTFDPEVARAKLDPRFADNARSEPAIAFSQAYGLLPMPVSGRAARAFGAKLSGGTKAPNFAIATRPNSRVRSPADGWVVYAGPFRSYGQLLILNVGEDHHVVMSGMADVNVTTGQFVLTGEPIGRMGLTQVVAAAALDLSSAQPVLYIEFRKDGQSIDPSPWWATSDNTRSKNDS